MSWSTLRGQIEDLLNDNANIQEVAGAPRIKFGGYPAAYVVPSDNEGDYESTSENIRTYAFLVRIFYETKDTGVADALDALEDIVDSVLDSFDEEDLKPATTRKIGINLPSNYTFINIFATPSAWAELEGEALIMAELRLRIRISVDIS